MLTRSRIATLVRQSAAHDLSDVLIGEGCELDDSRAADERRVHLEERVLGGGAHEHHEAILDGVQERVLLRLGEAVDLVHEQDGALAAHGEPAPGRLDGLAQVGDSRGDRGHLDEGGLGRRSDDPGE